MDNTTNPPTRTSSGTRSRQFKVYVGCLVLGFITGIALTGIPLLRAQRERDAVDQRLRLSNVELHLASAAVMARHGDYATARDEASQFFTEASAQIDTNEHGLTPPQQAHLQTVLSGRDELITLLARSDPAGAERATAIYVAYRSAFRQ